MKAGILNVQWLSNNGSVLIPYAMQKELDRLGVSNEIIDFRPQYPNEFGEIPSAHKEEKLATQQKVANFDRFRKRFLRRSAPLIGTEHVGQLAYDTYIVGSDTVWTPLRVTDPEAEVFHLEFLKGKHARRVAWAASIGSNAKDDLDMMRPYLSRRLRNFDYISVRERETASYIQNLTDTPVFIAIDPVLMFDQDDYVEILPVAAAQEGPYIHAFLFNDPAGAIPTINKLSAKTGLPVVGNVKSADLIDNMIVNCESDGPSEFVQRIFDAEYVITDSYHVVILSVLAQKPFVCYSRIGSGVRARNLLEDLGLTNRFLEEDENGLSLIAQDIDYGPVFDVVRAWRVRTENFLREALGLPL